LAVDRENRIWTATVDGLFLIGGLAARQITRVGMSQVAIEQDSLFHLGWESGAGELALFRSPITAQGLGPAKLLLRGHGKFFQDAKGRLWLPCGERVGVVEDPAGQARVTELGGARLAGPVLARRRPGSPWPHLGSFDRTGVGAAQRPSPLCALRLRKAGSGVSAPHERG